MTQTVDEYMQSFPIIVVYIDRLTMPKFLICTGGDEFFNNDDSFYYWNDLKGPKYIRSARCHGDSLNDSRCCISGVGPYPMLNTPAQGILQVFWQMAVLSIIPSCW